MNINIKAALNDVGVGGIARFNVPTMEVQLLEKKCKNIVLPKKKIVTVIHPVIHENETLSADEFIKDNRLEEIYSLFRLCARLSELQGGITPMIVIHMSGFATIEKGIAIVTRMEDLKAMYQIKPKIVFENTTICRTDGLFDNGFFKEPVNMASICNQISVDREYGTCLDICHAQSTVAMYELISMYDLNLSDFFGLYAPTCKLIHWNTCTGLGRAKKSHSLVVSREFAEVLRDMYEEYAFTADITIEVNEEDYTKYDNFETTYNNMKDLFIK